MIESGRPERLGPLMDENQRLLQAMGVSSPELERLIAAARGAGALGAKLSGGGRGGNMIALVAPGQGEAVWRRRCGRPGLPARLPPGLERKGKNKGPQSSCFADLYFCEN